MLCLSPKGLMARVLTFDENPKLGRCYALCRGYLSPGSGRVGFRVRTDVASVSGSLCRLVFLVQDFSHGQRARREVRQRERQRERQRGGKLQVWSGQCYTAMIFDN